MRDIVVPKLNTVDITYTLIEWLYSDGAMVPAGASVAVVETSKAAEELVCEHGGVLHQVVTAPTECALGTTIGHVFDSADDRERFLANPLPAAVPAHADGGGAPAGELIITDAARELMDRHDISESRVRLLGKKIVKSVDIERLVAEADSEPDESYVLSRSQRAVSEVVSRSHQTIPAASAVIKVNPAEALALLRRFAEQDRIILGLPELLVKCVASLHHEFPVFFASIQADGSVVTARAAHVGVTVDVGTGLYIPVIKDAARACLADIARTMMEFRVKALRGQFRPQDLDGGNIAISLNDDPAIVFAQPLILPPHVCMLSLCAPQEEAYVDPGGEVRMRPYVHIGLTYDHRLINGREAAVCLQALKALLESGERLVALDGRSLDGGTGSSSTTAQESVPVSGTGRYIK